MKTKTVGIIVLVFVVFGSIGCSKSRQGVYYWGDKAYARDPETGKIMSWEGKPSEEKKHYDKDAEEGALFVTSLLECIVN